VLSRKQVAAAHRGASIEELAEMEEKDRQEGLNIALYAQSEPRRDPGAGAKVAKGKVSPCVI
jgi:hypothetical protein